MKSKYELEMTLKEATVAQLIWFQGLGKIMQMSQDC
jgi:hypothetical protein